MSTFAHQDAAIMQAIPQSYGPNEGFRGNQRRSKFRGNKFMKTVYHIAQSEGYEPTQIASLFANMSSIDFIYGANSQNIPMGIPQSVWQRVSSCYNLFPKAPFHQQPMRENPVYFKEKSMVFIANQVTQQLIESQFILEQFPTAQRLYQYLHWTMRMSKVAHTVSKFVGQNGGEVLVIDVELHDQSGQRLYALCTPNDVVTNQTQPWQLATLMTAPQLISMLDINCRSLPRGVRGVSRQFAGFRKYMNLNALKRELQRLDTRRKPLRYAHLKSVKTGNNKQGIKGNSKGSPRGSKGKKIKESVLKVGFSQFYGAVRKALSDDSVELIPIVSVISKKDRSKGPKLEDFSVDYLLPVQIGQNSIGVVYRDNDCTMALLDGYDISNKAILCNPSFDIQSLNWFHNDYDRLRVVTDEEWKEYMNSMDSVPMTTPSLGNMDSNKSNLSMNSMDSVPVSVSPSTTMSRSPSLTGYSTQSIRSWSPMSTYSVPAMTVMSDLTLTPPPSVPNTVMTVSPEPVVNQTPQQMANFMNQMMSSMSMEQLINFMNQTIASAKLHEVYFKNASVKNAQFMRDLSRFRQ